MNSHEDDFGTLPATKEDIKNLEITMRAGFEACADLINCIILSNAQIHGELDPALVKVSTVRTKALFYTQFEEIKSRLAKD